MTFRFSSLRLLVLAFSGALIAACSGTPAAGPLERAPQPGVGDGIFQGVQHNALTPPALIGFDNRSGRLVFWPMQQGGGSHPQPVSGPLGLGYGSLAANGNVVAIAAQFPPQVVLFDVISQTATTLHDPYGTPVDIAVDKNGAIYVVNLTQTISNVTMYPAGSTQPRKLVCGKSTFGLNIAVDNEGDIFVNGFGPKNWAGVVEIPNGPLGPEPQNCTRLLLKREQASAGLAIDPKTDDLITLDNPDQCAGGIEGLMTIYPKPYQKSTARSHVVGVNCSGGLRLNADSTIVFVGDEDVSASHTFILQRSYPEGRGLGVYHGANTGGFTTIPNTLPN
jgi:hypothetical protein